MGVALVAFIRIDMERTPSYCLSRYLHAALTMIEKPKRKNEPAIMASDSMGEQSLPNNDSTPPIRQIAPIMPMALGTMLRSLRDSFFSINSLYRSYPDLGFSSIIHKFLHKVTNSCGAMQLCA